MSTQTEKATHTNESAKYYYESVGQGPPVVYLPGTGWTGLQGLHLAETLSDTYQSYLIDIPGIGRSEGIQGRIAFDEVAEWMKGFLDDRGIERADFVGHSLGGAMGLAFAQKYPDRVRKLVLLDIGHLEIDGNYTKMFGPIRYLLPFISMFERVVGPGRDKPDAKRYLVRDEAAIQSGMERALERGHYKLDNPDYLRQAMTIQPNAINSGLNLLLALYREHLPRILMNSKVDCMLVYGTYKDRPVKLQQKIHRAIERLRGERPDIKLVSVDAGHYPQWATEDVARNIRYFLTSDL